MHALILIPSRTESHVITNSFVPDALVSSTAAEHLLPTSTSVHMKINICMANSIGQRYGKQTRNAHQECTDWAHHLLTGAGWSGAVVTATSRSACLGAVTALSFDMYCAEGTCNTLKRSSVINKGHHFAARCACGHSHPSPTSRDRTLLKVLRRHSLCCSGVAS